MSRIFFFIVVFTFCSLFTFAQKARYQSDIVYRLSKHISWPEKKGTYKFVIIVLGSSDDFKSFQKLAVRKGAIQNIPIEVRHFDCDETLEDCHLLYISDACNLEMLNIIKKTKKDPVLIVSGRAGGGALGSIINFVDTNGKLKFELNKQQALMRGLEISDTLKDIAIII